MKPDSAAPHQFSLRWIEDLFAPAQPGKWHTREGYCVEVSKEHFEHARKELARGASEVYFEAVRTVPFDGAYYVLSRAFPV